MSGSFTVTEESSVAEIVFDDGGMNLLSTAALDELDQTLDRLSSGITVLWFRSGRNGTFAAGADMREMSGFDFSAARLFSRKGQRLFQRIQRFPAKTIALIDGDCFGGALDLAMAFDVRLSTSRSKFSHPGAKIGIVTGFGGTSRWRRLLSAGATSRLFLSSEVITADEAAELGIVTDVVDAAALAARRHENPGTGFIVAKLVSTTTHLSQLHSTLLAQRLTALYELRSDDGSHRDAH